jgi:uncharacterized SAM-binding protein YcdF (DUF218 family)
MMLEILKGVVLPSNICLLLAVIGIAMYMFRLTRRSSRWILAGAGVLLIAFSSGWTATALLAPLEYSSSFAGARSDDPPASAIVVLAAYAADDPEMPLSSRPNGAALFRIVEAMLLRKQCAGCLLYVTGSSPTVEVMGELLISLGVPARDLVLDTRAMSTMHSAVNLQDRVRPAPFFLVTSAGHMPRALAVFRKLGLQPLPAPTDYQLPRDPSHASWLPSPQHLYFSDLAIHEYLGIVWYWLMT